jgi:hypothetical protein
MKFIGFNNFIINDEIERNKIKELKKKKKDQVHNSRPSGPANLGL